LRVLIYFLISKFSLAGATNFIVAAFPASVNLQGTFWDIQRHLMTRMRIILAGRSKYTDESRVIWTKDGAQHRLKQRSEVGWHQLIGINGFIHA